MVLKFKHQNMCSRMDTKFDVQTRLRIDTLICVAIHRMQETKQNTKQKTKQERIKWFEIFNGCLHQCHFCAPVMVSQDTIVGLPCIVVNDHKQKMASVARFDTIGQFLVVILGLD